MKNIIELETPCFIINSMEFKENVANFQNALDCNFEESILAYSVKTNSFPYILSLACESGCFAEVVSYDEYNLALKSGFLPSQIVYNGPAKNKETFLDALKNGSYVNIETMREVQWLGELKNQNPESMHLGIRLNINLGQISPEDAKDGEDESRFGFSFENGEFESVMRAVQDLGFKVTGVHAHRTSLTRSLNVYESICGYLNEVLEKTRLEVECIDIGGGFYGNLQGKPCYREYSDIIKKTLNISKHCKLILEPGNGLIASPVDYVLSIIDKKNIADKIILSTDGTRLDIDPFFHKTKYTFNNLFSENRKSEEEKQILCGCTCLENDKIMEVEGTSSYNVGDRVLFRNVGAYTMTLTPNFIRAIPRVYAFDGAEYTLVRNKGDESNWQTGLTNISMELSDTYLFTNAGRRATLLKNFKKSLGNSAKIIATDNWCVAPALFTADEYYITPKITTENYIEHIMELCKKENVKVITSLIDPEIEILASHRDEFKKIGVLPLCPDLKTARLCFDKYEMYRYLTECGINTVLTFSSLSDFDEALHKNKIDFPVFIKPRTGSGSVGAEKIHTYDELKERFKENKFDYIIQEFMDCEDCDADVYVDTISNKAVSTFLKKKIETRIGGASKTICFKDQKLFDFIQEIVKHFNFNGPIDMDFFCRDGVYYLSEVNPRFGGAYLHPFGAGVDFPKFIRNNVHGIENEVQIGNYEDGSIMLMYDDVIITNEKDLCGDYRD